MGLLTKAVKTLQFLATSIALLSIYDLSNVTYKPTHQNTLECGFSQHFNHFLQNNNYSSFNFTRPDIKCGCFGGKNSDIQQLKKIPIIFIHGNSDVAFGKGSDDGYLPWQTGFRALATFLINQGWDKSELYTTTWGSNDPLQSQNNYHSKNVIMHLRKFVEAVINYTKAKQIIIISHSMGVTLARKIIKGGLTKDHADGEYNVGQNLGEKVKVFIGIAGANLGLTHCYDKSQILTCGQIDGFSPGNLPSSGPSKFLNDLNTKQGSQGQNVYSIWSKYDDLMGFQSLVWGKVTSKIPSQTSQIIKDSKQWNHFHLRDNVGPDILKWISPSK